MFHFFRSAVLILMLTITAISSAQASTLSFDAVTPPQFDAIVKELSADMSYYSVTPASSLGTVWGLEAGLTAGITKTPDIQGFVKQAGNNDAPGFMPHAGLLARVGVPLGITGEALFIPSKTVSNISFKETGAALQWTFSDVLIDEPFFNMAVKAFYIKTSIDYTQTINNSSTGNIPVTGAIDFSDSSKGVQFLISKKWFIFEPYVALGYIKANGTLSVSAAGTATIFSQTFSQSVTTSASSKPSSSELIAGLDMRFLWIVSLGAEYERLFGKSGYTARLSFRF